MAAYLIAVNKVIDQEKMQEYAAGAGPTLASAGAKVLVRGAVAETLAGDLSGDIALVIEFPDIETARSWYQSPEYQAMISTREQAMDPQFVLVEAPPA
jgi:uncharacterized protein (DUF1330 family)|tara:strand:+ start:817 stop:1110 length:294 start_codon:yes stop_codon:yes gene_type:complete